MPANLNALLRYKTINSCLHGGRRKWSIEELRIACSDALAESRGRYETISERTIRDDIRVMRSDMLGFGAPIDQKNGLYYYSDPNYSIMSISITDAGLADQIIALLRELRSEISHPELETILNRLVSLTGSKSSVQEIVEAPMLSEELACNPRRHRGNMSVPESTFEPENDYVDDQERGIKFHIRALIDEATFVTWGEVMEFFL